MIDPILITFDMSPTGQPEFTATPELDKVPWGSSPTLLWKLAPGPGADGAQFDPVNGIHFQVSAQYPAQWPNAQPTPVADSNGLQYSASDPNTVPDQVTTIYKYNVTVVLNGQSYTWDPEEENEGKGA
jgi:hypothetical protein